MPIAGHRFASPTKKPTSHLARIVEQAEPDYDNDRPGPEHLDSKNLNPSNILNLQRTMGNQAVMRLLEQRQSGKPALASNEAASNKVIQRKLAWDVRNLEKIRSMTGLVKNSTLNQLINELKDYKKDPPEKEFRHLLTMKKMVEEWLSHENRNGKKAVQLVFFMDSVNAELDMKLNEFAKKVGFAMSFLKELEKQKAPNPLVLLYEADYFIETGQIGKADAILVRLKEVLGAPYNVVKGQLIRANMDIINPEMHETLTDQKWEQKNEEKAKKGAEVYDAVDAESGYTGYKDSLQNDKKLDQPAAPAVTDPNARKAMQANKKQNKLINEEAFANLSIMDTLSKREKDSVQQYTANNFEDINSSLRGMNLKGNDRNEDTEGKSHWGNNARKFTEEKQAYTQNTISALNKLPPYQGEVYRHDNYFDGFEQVYREGATVSDMAFMSTTYDPTSLQATFGKDILSVIISKSGRFVKPLSISRHEDEVLFKPGTRFKVTKVVKAQLIDTDPNFRDWPEDLLPSMKKALYADPNKKDIKWIVLREEV